MNGARTTFMRRGYLLTALAAVVLLAASSGTASAQSVGFVGTSGMVKEGASSSPNTPQRLTVTVQRTVTAVTQPGNGSNLTLEHNGADVGATINASYAPATAVATASQLAFPAGVNEISLAISVAEDNADWDDETLTLTLRSTATGVVADPGVFNVTIEDNEAKPEFRFSRTAIQVAEDSNTMVDVSVGVGPVDTPREDRHATALNALSGDGNAAAATGSDGEIVLFINPPGAIASTGPVVISTVAADGTATNVALSPAANFPAGHYDIGDISTAVATAESISLRIAANPDKSGFTDSMITLTLMDGRSRAGKGNGGGAIGDAEPAMVTVLSDEAAPTLSFSPTDVTIDEGDSTETVLLAEGQLANDVGMVKLMVEGDAMVDLYHDGAMLEEMDGYVMVDLGDNNSARLTAMSTSDPDLMDGDMAYKAWKLTEDSSDAAIGDGYWFRVDVRGSTAVPALPLVGQLLLALFLMAGGSRLYRRRQG